MMVPITALIAATTKEPSRLRRSAARACGEVTALQNPSQPPANERKTTAASGMSTITLI